MALNVSTTMQTNRGQLDPLRYWVQELDFTGKNINPEHSYS